MPSLFSSITQQAVEKANNILTQQPLFLDTETTGLDSTDEIVEIALVDYSGKILFHSLVRPQKLVPADAIRIHGITNDELKTAPFWFSVWQHVKPALDGKIIATYNSDFDSRMMQQSHKKANLNWFQTFSFFDILGLYSQFRGDWDPIRRSFRFFKLEEAGRNLKIPLPNSHRAVDDALLARAVLFRIAGSSGQLPPAKAGGL